MLAARLKALKWSRREFARRVGKSHGFIDLILNGRSGSPDEPVVAAWAATLGIEAQERERFLLAAAWTRTPRRVKEHIWHAVPTLFARDPDGGSPMSGRVTEQQPPYRARRSDR